MKKIILGGISAGCFVLIAAGSVLPQGAASVPGFSMSYTGTPTSQNIRHIRPSIRTAPVITKFQVTSPADMSIMYKKQCTIKGVSPVTAVLMNKTRLSVDKKGAFVTVAPLKSGKNVFTFKAGTATETLHLLKLPGFIDITEKNKAKKDIESVALLGYFGELKTTFRPAQPILRGEMAMVCTKLAELPIYPAAQMAKSLFKDVTAKTPYRQYIYSVGLQRLMPGAVDGNFYPLKKVTRAEAVVLIARAAKLPLPEGQPSSPFTDVPDRHWSIPALHAALKSGVIPQTKTFSPNTFVTRGDIALWISRTPIVKQELTALFSFDDQSEGAQ